MNLFDLRLVTIRAVEVKGESFNFDDSQAPGFAARFKAEIIDDIDDLQVGESFNAELSFSGRSTEEDTPFFSFALSGTFEVLGESALADVKGEHGSYQVATFLFPYLRNLAKPVLEHLGAADVDFPFHLPPPPTSGKSKSSKGAKSKKA